MATAYLVMACGTGGDNGTTVWSVNAVEKYTRISRSRAKTAIEQLIGAGSVAKVKSGFFPRYKLRSILKLAEAGLPSSLASVLGKVRVGTPLTKQQAKSARSLVSRGFATEEPSEQFKAVEDTPQLA